MRLCAGLSLATVLVACVSVEPRETAASDFKPPVPRAFKFEPAPARARIDATRMVVVAKPLYMPTGQQVMPPMGYIGYCLHERSDCAGGTDEPLPFALTPQRRAELGAVNAAVNALPEMSDKDLYGRDEVWTYASTRGGDCEDLVLEKRRRLTRLGWPADALLIATGRNENNEGHAVLIAATASGDFVLDNRDPHIRLWSEVSYHWLTRQSRERPFVWVSLDEPHFSLHPIAYFPPLGRPAPFLDQTIMVSLTKEPSSASSVSSQATQARQLPELRK